MQIEVQKYVSTLKAKNQVLQAIPPVILVSFAGHWSDRHGRKLLMVIAMFGFIISNTVFLLNILFLKTTVLTKGMRDMGGKNCLKVSK